MHKNFATLHFHIKQYRANSYDIVITLGKKKLDYFSRITCIVRYLSNGNKQYNTNGS